jgi:hypothetical protein
MTDTVRLTTGGQPQRFPWNLPDAPTALSTLANGNSQPIPKDGTFSTYVAAIKGTSGTVSATVVVQATNDPHTAGADDPSLLAGPQRNNFLIGTTNTSTAITSKEGLFRPDMDGDEVYATGVANGTTMAYVSPTAATLSAAASSTGTVHGRFQSFQWVLLATISLTGTKQAADGFATQSDWKWVRGVVSSITGTGAAVTVTQEA